MSNNSFMTLIESYDVAKSSIHNIFGNEGTNVGKANLDPRKFEEAVSLTASVMNGRRPLWVLREALSTSDFPLYFGNVLDRMVVAEYMSRPSTFRQFLKVSTVRDFRTVERFRFSDGTQRMEAVGQGESYPVGDRDESRYTFSVGKYGRRFDMFWEVLVNDDLDALQNMPTVMARAALNTEMYFAASLYVNNTTLYSDSHSANGATYDNNGEAPLSLGALKLAMETMAAFPGAPNKDGFVEPIMNTPRFLVVPPQLEYTAREILSTQTIQLYNTGGTAYSNSREVVDNILQGMLTVLVDPYIPIVDATNGATSWYLFADPAEGHAAEVGFLAGHETPQMFMKSPNAMLLSGGTAQPVEGDFDTDSVGYKVRHVMGGSHANAIGNWRFTYRSTGAG